VDFCVVADGRPTTLVEAKWSETDVDPSLARYSRALAVPGVQLVKDLRREERLGSVEVRAATAWLKGLSV
jgi:hypothetical protein